MLWYPMNPHILMNNLYLLLSIERLLTIVVTLNLDKTMTTFKKLSSLTSEEEAALVALYGFNYVENMRIIERETDLRERNEQSDYEEWCFHKENNGQEPYERDYPEEETGE